MERVAGFEPASSAWKAEVLPLNDTRMGPYTSFSLERLDELSHSYPNSIYNGGLYEN